MTFQRASVAIPGKPSFKSVISDMYGPDEVLNGSLDTDSGAPYLLAKEKLVLFIASGCLLVRIYAYTKLHIPFGNQKSKWKMDHSSVIFLSITSSINRGVSIAMFDYQRVYLDGFI